MIVTISKTSMSTLLIQCTQCGADIVCQLCTGAPDTMKGYLFQGCCLSVGDCEMKQKTVYCCSLYYDTERISSSGKNHGYIPKWKYIGRHAKTQRHKNKLPKLGDTNDKRYGIRL